VVTVTPEHREALLALASQAGVPAAVIGRTGGGQIRVAVAGQPGLECTVMEAEQVWSSALSKHFAGRAA
jgi:hypothetical protein